MTAKRSVTSTERPAPRARRADVIRRAASEAVPARPRVAESAAIVMGAWLERRRTPIRFASAPFSSALRLQVAA